MLTKHYFDKNGNFAGRASIGSLPVPEGGSVIENSIGEYPYPIKLEEGVIVQDTEQEPFEGKWRKASEVKELKAARAKATKS